MTLYLKLLHRRIRWQTSTNILLPQIRKRKLPQKKKKLQKLKRNPLKRMLPRLRTQKKLLKRQLQRAIRQKRLKKLPRAKRQKVPRKLRRLNPKSPRKIRKRIKLQSPCSQELRAICATLTQEADRLSLINTTRDMKTSLPPFTVRATDRQINRSSSRNLSSTASRVCVHTSVKQRLKDSRESPKSVQRSLSL